MERLGELLMIDNPLPTSPLSGGGALAQLCLLPKGDFLARLPPWMLRNSLTHFPPLTRGGLVWGYPKALGYILSCDLLPTLIAQFPLQLPDKKLIQAKLHELLAQEREGER